MVHTSLMLIGITHLVSPHIGRCELTWRERERIDFSLAARQHAEYRAALARCGVHTITLSANAERHPDCCFVEDTAIVTDEFAIIASMGALSRRCETALIRDELAKFRSIKHITLPATLDGGDCILNGKQLFVGVSSRTNRLATDQLTQILEPHGYAVVAVPVRKSLHLSTACSFIDDETVLVNDRWIDAEIFKRYNVLPVPESEPWAANTLRVGDTVFVEDGAPRTLDLVSKVRGRVETVNISELRKAEGSLTCISIIFATDSMHVVEPEDCHTQTNHRK